MTFKHLKAPSESIAIEDVRFPTIASYKLDGLRASHHGRNILSKTLKEFPNLHVNGVFKGQGQFEYLDGELVVGNPYGEDVIRRTSSGIMSRAGEPAFTWWVFDNFKQPSLPYHLRLSAVKAAVKALGRPYVKLMPSKLIRNAAELLALETWALDKSYEGLMLRDPQGIYKFGTATAREGIIFKFKRFIDAEAYVVRLEEGTVNSNEKKADGKRRTLKAGMAPSGLVGTLICMDLKTGGEIRVAPGRLTHSERQEFMQYPKRIIGRIITYRSFPTGTVNAPRFPTFQTFRDPSTL